MFASVCDVLRKVRKVPSASSRVDDGRRFGAWAVSQRQASTPAPVSSRQSVSHFSILTPAPVLGSLVQSTTAGPSSENMNTPSMPFARRSVSMRLDGGLRDRSPDVEGCVHRNLDADSPSKRLQIGVGYGIGMLAHNLQPRGSVGVDDGGNLRAGVRLGSHGQDHVVIGVVFIVRRALGQVEQSPLPPKASPSGRAAGSLRGI